VCDSIYTKNGKIKIKLALVKAKKRWDKRETIKNKENDKYINKIVNKY
jgi:tmRNA-binding protein